MDARETDTWQCPRLTIRNIHQQHRITGSRHRTVTRWAHTFKPQLPPPLRPPHWFTYVPHQQGVRLPTEPWAGRRPLSCPTPSLSLGHGCMLTILSLPRWKVSPCQNRRL